MFYSKGFKDTNISEIAKLAGIGVGTFYNYYTSKEKLFIEVYFKENEDHKRRLLESMDWTGDPVTLITRMVTQNAIEMNSNLILKEWYNKELFSKLEQQFYEQGGKQAVRMGRWKGVRMPAFTGKMQLFDLENDLGEGNDVAKEHPDIVGKIEDIMKEAHHPDPVWQARGRLPKNAPEPGDGKSRF